MINTFSFLYWQHLFLVIAMFALSPYLFAFKDLEECPQDFILETKKIEITEFQYPFNPSIVRWKGRFLMSFRFYATDGSKDSIGFIWLDEDFNPISSPSLLQKPFRKPSWFQDPRLIVSGEHLYLVYNNIGETPFPMVRRMFIAELHEDGEHFFIDEEESLTEFEGNHLQRHEKNWVPFDYDGNLLLSYSLFPHRVFIPLLRGSSRCETFSVSTEETQWSWGEVRGGTPALLQEDGEYLAFFHSVVTIASVQSEGKVMPHYVMGAYTFASQPPFTMTRISPEPLIGKNFYNGPAYKTWAPIRVVFPCGFVANDTFIWIAYGRQDHEIWIAKLDKKKLYQSLLTIRRKNS